MVRAGEGVKEGLRFAKGTPFWGIDVCFEPFLTDAALGSNVC